MCVIEIISVFFGRCVVSSLTEEGPNDLAEELVRGEAVQIDENNPTEEGVEDWDTWTPDPIDGVTSIIFPFI